MYYKDEDYVIQCHVEGLNLRFAPGEPLEEMVRLQKKFKVFSQAIALEDSIALLNVTGASWPLRRKWNRLIEWIGTLESNYRQMKGGAAISTLLKANLEGNIPLPVYFTTHDFDVDPAVLVNDTGASPIFYLEQSYLIVSLPLRANPYAKKKKKTTKKKHP